MKKQPQKLLIISPDPLFHRPAQTTAHSPVLNFHIMKSRDQTSVLLSVVEMFGVDMCFNLLERWHFNPGLFNPKLFNHERCNHLVQKIMVEKSGVEEFMVEKSRVEMSGLNLGVEHLGVDMSFNRIWLLLLSFYSHKLHWHGLQFIRIWNENLALKGYGINNGTQVTFINMSFMTCLYFEIHFSKGCN